MEIVTLSSMYEKIFRICHTKKSLLFPTNKRREKVQYDLRVKIFNFLNKFLQGSPILRHILILIALYCSLKFFDLGKFIISVRGGYCDYPLGATKKKVATPVPILTSCCRLQLKCDDTRWRTGGEVKGKLANGVGSQYASHYLGTWFIEHYYRWCAHLGCQ